MAGIFRFWLPPSFAPGCCCGRVCRASRMPTAKWGGRKEGRGTLRGHYYQIPPRPVPLKSRASPPRPLLSDDEKAAVRPLVKVSHYCGTALFFPRPPMGLLRLTDRGTKQDDDDDQTHRLLINPPGGSKERAGRGGEAKWGEGGGCCSCGSAVRCAA